MRLRPVFVRPFGLVAGILALALLVMSSLARPQAQGSAPASSLAQLLIVDVKPEAWDDYVALQKAETMPALQKAGIERRRAWRSAGLGTGFRVAYVYPLASFGEMDAPGPILRALGEEGARTYNARLRRHLNGVRYVALRTRADLSYGLEGPLPKLGVLAHVQTIAGQQFAFENLLKDQWAPALKKGGVGMYSVQEVVMGGEMGEYYTFTPIEKFATLDAGHPIQKTLGAAEYQSLVQKMGGTIRSVEREVLRLDESLSFNTKAPGTK